MRYLGWLFWVGVVLTSCTGIIHSGHLEKSRLRAKYPNAILTEDYGIILEEDILSLIRNFTFQAIPKYHSDFSYFQCFDANTLVMSCGDMGKDGKTQMAFGTIRGKLKGVTHEYYLRKILPIDVCQEFLNEWASLLKGEQHACLAGAYGPYFEKEKIYSWVWERLRTRKGYSFYLYP